MNYCYEFDSNNFNEEKPRVYNVMKLNKDFDQSSDWVQNKKLIDESLVFEEEEHHNKHELRYSDKSSKKDDSCCCTGKLFCCCFRAAKKKV